MTTGRELESIAGPVSTRTHSGSYAASLRMLAQSSVDAVARLGRPFHPREAQRKYRGHGGDAARDAESGLTEEGDVRGIVFWELHLPDTDPVEARVGIGDDVFLEGRVDRGDLAEGELHRLSPELAQARAAAAVAS